MLHLYLAYKFLKNLYNEKKINHIFVTMIIFGQFPVLLDQYQDRLSSFL